MPRPWRGRSESRGDDVLDWVLRSIVRFLLALRYRIVVRGLERIAQRGTRGILFLPNHPALIDPLILMALLNKRFRPRALADQDQINRPLIRPIGQHIGVIPLPDIKLYGPDVRPEVEAAQQACRDALRRGENLLLYPAGHLYRTRHEDLRGNSAAHDLLHDVPAVRVVLVRTRGLWGSSLSLAHGEFPNLARLARLHAWNLLRNFVFFMPRRPITIEFVEPTDLPRNADRRTLNAWLEHFYNSDAPPNTHIAYTWSDRPLRQVRADPQWGGAAQASGVSAATRRIVLAHLREQTGSTTIRDADRLAQDLGLDSLARAEILLWLAREFGQPTPAADSIYTVGDLLLAARGETVTTRPPTLRHPGPGWHRDSRPQRVGVPPGRRITDTFLAAARAAPGRVVLADQLRGELSYRRIITGILALQPALEALAGERVGIMLPASAAATVTYWATLFAGKVPVLVNWTTGIRNVMHTLEMLNVQHVLTAGALLPRLETQGHDLDPLRPRLVLLEHVGGRISRWRKLAALARSYLDWSPLTRARVPDTIAILMTSGSESLPKAVPLTHTNVLTNIRDVLEIIGVRGKDRLLGFLPPFHSFGLTVTVVAPLVAGLPTVYHANPTEGVLLARLIALYRPTILLGTPTFLSGILRAATGTGQLRSIRIAVTGAEKCPQHVYHALSQRCPRAAVLEGYGITECSPIVAVNRMEHLRPGTVGQVLPSLEYALVDVDTGRPVEPGRPGLLLVRGPSVFGGYLGDNVASAFVEHDGKRWYRTGDLLSADADGVLTFRGRLKRFVKRGGEMISLPAIEAALLPHFVAANDEGPGLAVVATPDETRPELTLFTTRPADRQQVNTHLRAAGLSALHNIDRVVPLAEIPLLGNGKTDYRALQTRLSELG